MFPFTSVYKPNPGVIFILFIYLGFAKPHVHNKLLLNQWNVLIDIIGVKGYCKGGLNPNSQHMKTPSWVFKDLSI